MPRLRAEMQRLADLMQRGDAEAAAEVARTAFRIARSMIRLDTLDDFNTAFLAGQIAQRSRLIPLRDCKKFSNNDDAQHHITFQLNQPGWNEHSERVFHEESFTGRDMHHLYSRTRDTWRRVDRQFALGLFERIATAARTEIEREEQHLAPRALSLLADVPRDLGRNELLLRASQVASVVFGSALVLVGSAE